MNHGRDEHPNTGANTAHHDRDAIVIYLRAVLSARVVRIAGGLHAIRLGTGELGAVHASHVAMCEQLTGAQRCARELGGVMGIDDLEDPASFAPLPKVPSARAQIRERALDGAAAVIRAAAGSKVST